MTDTVIVSTPPARDLMHCQAAPSHGRVARQRPAANGESGDNEGDGKQGNEVNKNDGSGEGKNLTIKSKDTTTPTPPPAETDPTRCSSVIQAISTCTRGPILFIDKCPYPSHPDHVRTTSYRRGRCPALETLADGSQRHFHALVPPSPVNVDVSKVTSLQLEFGKYAGSGSLSDGFQARLSVANAASTPQDSRRNDETAGEASAVLADIFTSTEAVRAGDHDEEHGAKALDLDTFPHSGRPEPEPHLVAASTNATTQTSTFDVVVKLVRPGYRIRKGLARSDVMNHILGEADLYTTNMLPLQGTVVPRFYGVWALEREPCLPSGAPAQEQTWSDSLSECVLTILEDVGEPFKPDHQTSRVGMAESDREMVRDAHRALHLHRVGVIHGEASHKMSHSRLDTAGRIRLIDFERSERCEPVVDGEPTPKVVAYELERLNCYLRGDK